MGNVSVAHFGANADLASQAMKNESANVLKELKQSVFAKSFTFYFYLTARMFIVSFAEDR